MLDITAGYDPRITPSESLSASAGESPGATLSRFLATTEQRFALDRARLAEGARFDVRMPYGAMDWTVRVLHGLWDSWLHERDVLLPRGIEHPAGGVFDLDSRGGVTLTVTRATTAGPPAAGVADALACRSPVAAALSDLPASSRGALSLMADFFNSPVGQSPA